MPVRLRPAPGFVLALVVAPTRGATTGPGGGGGGGGGGTAATLAVASGNGQTATAGETLPQPLTVRATRSGSPAAGVTVTFAVQRGGGRLAAATTTTDAQGLAAVTFTVGDTAGSETNAVTASAGGNTVTFTASATAAAPDRLSPVQLPATGQAGQPLPEPVRLLVADRFGNPVPGTQVAVAVESGGGTVSPGIVTTALNGIAQVTWTLGPASGVQQLRVTSPFVAAPLVTGLTALNVSIAAISAPGDTLRSGVQFTVAGTDLAFAGQQTRVFVDGIPATTVSATPTSVTATAPEVPCSPTRRVPVVVEVGAARSGPVQRPYATTGFGSGSLPAVGQQVVVGPVDGGICLQFPATAATERYLVGILNIGEDPSILIQATMQGVGAGLAPAFQPRKLWDDVLTTAVGPRRYVPTPDERRWVEHREAEQRLRELERRTVPARGSLLEPGRLALRRGVKIPAGAQVGDTVQITFPNLAGNLCQVAATLQTVVRARGQYGIWLDDGTNASAAAGGFTTDDWQALSNALDQSIYAVDTAYFGGPSDIDQNGRIGIVVTNQVNRATGFGTLLGFVTSADLFPRQSPSGGNCPASNEGEIFYGRAPDPAGTAGAAYPRSRAILDYPFLIAHEFTHIIQFSRRLSGNRPNMAAWEAEGQATLAEEVNGFAIEGNGPGQELGVAAALNVGTPDPINWFGSAFSDLAGYFGFPNDTLAPQLPGAPEQCTMLSGTPGTRGPCLSSRAIYGVPWSLQRWATDRARRLGGPGADQALMRAFTDNGIVGLENLAGLVGLPREQMLARWAAALYLDGRGIPGLSPELQFTSWDLFRVYHDSIFDPAPPTGAPRFRRFRDNTRLLPRLRGFTAFSDDLAIRAASSSFTVIEGAGRGEFAVRIRGPLGQAIAPTARVWVVRLE